MSSLPRRARQSIRRLADAGIPPDELAEIGAIVLSAMPLDDSRAWRQIARQCNRRDQVAAAAIIGAAVQEAWIERQAARLTR